ncbi:MAG TPA: lysylphosphatidylglycerol synthase domain-containing protein [Rhizomicrobium sp.]
MKFLGALAFAAGLGVLGWLLVHFGTAPIGAAWSTLGFSGLAIVVAAHLPVAAFLGFAWWSLGRDVVGAGPLKFIWARLVRDGAAEVLPFSQVGGYVFGARALTLSGVSGFFAAISTVVDLVVELAAKLPYLLIGLALLAVLKPESAYFVPVLIGVAISTGLLILALIFRDRSRGALERLAMRMAQRWPALHLGEADQTRATISGVLAKDGRAAAGFAFHFIAWALGAFEAWIAFRLMGADISLAEAAVIDSLFTGLRTFAFFIPGAIGVQEAAYVALCAMFGISPGLALAFSLVRRGRDFLIGVPCLFGWQLTEGRRALFARQAVAVTDGD